MKDESVSSLLSCFICSGSTNRTTVASSMDNERVTNENFASETTTQLVLTQSINQTNATTTARSTIRKSSQEVQNRR